MGLIFSIEQQHFQLPEFKVRCVAKYHHEIYEYSSEVVQIRTESQEYSEIKYDTSYANNAIKGRQIRFSVLRLIYRPQNTGDYGVKNHLSPLEIRRRN